MGPGLIMLIMPFFFFMVLSVVVFAIFVNMIIVMPYYAFFKRLRLYYWVKQQKRTLKEQPQRFCQLEKSEKEQVYQNSILDTEEKAFIFQKWLAFSWKDYSLVSCLSLIIMAFKTYVYIAFFQQMGPHVDEKRFVVLVCFVMALFLISACVFLSVPVIVVLRARLTSRLKKKIQQLEELTRKQEKSVYQEKARG
ncbi:hypothetical protein [Bartonella harrusi]|uniref:Uncharacterized protein n=1 Tax=Bartonella harrusi TaxID=2961895 RepID=A0ABY5ESR3_9HYPH|nr:hypothetical protein [Bartonella harrusi]UTO28179.1 hypothetical protein NMK50_08395 [Bartonella harrusi]